VRAAAGLRADPGAALELWTDPERWPGFVEGFERVVELDGGWPAVGATAVWESGPEGRGRVTERVVEYVPAERFATEVAEAPPGGGPPRLRGRQSLAIAGGAARGAAADAPSSEVELRLDYELVRGRGSPGAITDLLFVRRALRDALRRTLERFVAETERPGAR
jgi:hypothetical protein